MALPVRLVLWEYRGRKALKARRVHKEYKEMLVQLEALAQPDLQVPWAPWALQVLLVQREPLVLLVLPDPPVPQEQQVKLVQLALRVAQVQRVLQARLVPRVHLAL